MKRYLVTGARGFVGSHLAAYLRAQNPKVDVLAVGREVDLRDPAAVDRLMREAGRLDYIFHLADVSGNARWAAENAGTQFFGNARMALNVLESVSRHQQQARLVGFSSVWAYPAALEVARESDYWSGPLPEGIEHYGVTKKLLGSGLAACKRQFGVHGTILVLGSVYGPGDRSDHVIPSLIRRMREDPETLEVWGSGEQVRDFIYIEDQVRGIDLHKDFEGDLLNVSGGNAYSIRRVVEVLCRLLRYTGKVIFRMEEGGKPDIRTMDMSAAERATGWPGNFRLRSLEEGLELTLKGTP